MSAVPPPAPLPGSTANPEKEQIPMRNILVVLACVVAVPARADDVPEKYRPTVEKGLAWLVKQQYRDGHFSAAGDQYAVSMTALAGLALVAEGSTPQKGKHAQAIHRAAAWLMEQNQKGTAHDGLFGKLDAPGETGRYLFGHGYAILFLATVLDDLEPKERYIAAKDGGDFDEGASSMVQIHGLNAAAAAGIPGTADVLKNAFKYVEKLTTPQGGVLYSLSSGGGERPPLTAAALGAGAADASSPLIKKWHQSCSRVITLAGGRGGYDEFTVHYYSQAVYALGEEGWAKLFPDSREAERVVWSKYRTIVFDQLNQRQQADGSWTAGSAGAGPVHATAVHLIVLQLDKGHLPIQRR
jgi:hypothetical protein